VNISRNDVHYVITDTDRAMPLFLALKRTSCVFGEENRKEAVQLALAATEGTGERAGERERERERERESERAREG
jgi:hypothetical protein